MVLSLNTCTLRVRSEVCLLFVSVVNVTNNVHIFRLDNSGNNRLRS